MSLRILKMQSFSFFDFDNLPEFEPLENTLELLRPNAYNNEAMDKLLEVDTNDLLDHPQWTEFLDLLKPSLLIYNKLVYNGCTKGDTLEVSMVNTAIKSIRIHQILVASLNTHQLVDIVTHLLDAYFILFLYPLNSSEHVEKKNAWDAQESVLIQLINDLHIDLFMKIIEVISTPSVVGSDTYNVDKIRFAIFTLLSHGIVYDNVKNTTVPLYEYIICSSSTSGIAARKTGLEYYHRIMEEKHRIEAESVLNHAGNLNISLSSWSTCNSVTSAYMLSIAHQTGFIQRLLGCIEHVTVKENGSFEKDGSALIWCTSVNIFFQLISDFTSSGCNKFQEILRVCCCNTPMEGSVLDINTIRVLPDNNNSSSIVAKTCPMAPPFVRWIPMEHIKWSNKKYHQMLCVASNNCVFDAYMNVSNIGLQTFPNGVTPLYSWLTRIVQQLRQFVPNMKLLNKNTANEILTSDAHMVDETRSLLMDNILSDIFEVMNKIVFQYDYCSVSDGISVARNTNGVDVCLVATSLKFQYACIYKDFVTNIVDRTNMTSGVEAETIEYIKLIKDILVVLYTTTLCVELPKCGMKDVTMLSTSSPMQLINIWSVVLEYLSRYCQVIAANKEDTVLDVRVEHILAIISQLLSVTPGEESEVEPDDDDSQNILWGVCSGASKLLHYCSQMKLGLALEVQMQNNTDSPLLYMALETTINKFYQIVMEFYLVIYQCLNDPSCAIECEGYVLRSLTCALISIMRTDAPTVEIFEAQYQQYAVDEDGNQTKNPIQNRAYLLQYLLSTYIVCLDSEDSSGAYRELPYLLNGICEFVDLFPTDSINYIMTAASPTISTLLTYELGSYNIYDNAFAYNGLEGGVEGGSYSPSSCSKLWSLMELLYCMCTLGWINEALAIFLNAASQTCVPMEDVSCILTRSDAVTELLDLLLKTPENSESTGGISRWWNQGFFICVLRMFSVAIRNVAFQQEVRDQLLTRLGLTLARSADDMGSFSNGLVTAINIMFEPDEDKLNCFVLRDEIDCWRLSILKVLFKSVCSTTEDQICVGENARRDSGTCRVLEICTGFSIENGRSKKTTVDVVFRFLLDVVEEHSPIRHVSLVDCDLCSILTPALALDRENNAKTDSIDDISSSNNNKLTVWDSMIPNCTCLLDVMVSIRTFGNNENLNELHHAILLHLQNHSELSIWNVIGSFQGSVDHKPMDMCSSLPIDCHLAAGAVGTSSAAEMELRASYDAWSAMSNCSSLSNEDRTLNMWVQARMQHLLSTVGIRLEKQPQATSTVHLSYHNICHLVHSILGCGNVSKFEKNNEVSNSLKLWQFNQAKVPAIIDVLSHYNISLTVVLRLLLTNWFQTILRKRDIDLLLCIYCIHFLNEIKLLKEKNVSTGVEAQVHIDAFERFSANIVIAILSNICEQLLNTCTDRKGIELLIDIFNKDGINLINISGYF